MLTQALVISKQIYNRKQSQIMKKFITPLLILVTLFSSSFTFAFAQAAGTTSQTTTPASGQTVQTTQTNTTTTTPTLKTQITDARVANLMGRADTEISRRITALNTIISKLTDIKHLTDTQKASFSSQISTEISNLTALKTKIDADTDLPTLKTDVQSIITSYRVFAFFVPQIHLLAASDKILNISDTMNDFATKLAGRITQAQNSGQDVTTIQTLLTDMQKNISDAKAQANNVITTVSALTPTGYPANLSDLQSSRKMLETARTDLVTALQDAKRIIQTLKESKTPGTPSVTSAVVSPTNEVISPTSIQTPIPTQ